MITYKEALVFTEFCILQMYQIHLFCDKLGENLVKDSIENLTNILSISMRMFESISVKGSCTEIGSRKWVHLH